MFYLLLDDLDDGIITYLYPVYNEPLSLFSFIDTEFFDVGILYYGFAGAVAVFHTSSKSTPK